MSKVTDVTGHGGKETKVTSQGKQGIQHDRLGKREEKKCVSVQLDRGPCKPDWKIGAWFRMQWGLPESLGYIGAHD